MAGSCSISDDFSKINDVPASCSRGVGGDGALAIVLILERGIVDLNDGALMGACLSPSQETLSPV